MQQPCLSSLLQSVLQHAMHQEGGRHLQRVLNACQPVTIAIENRIENPITKVHPNWYPRLDLTDDPRLVSGPNGTEEDLVPLSVLERDQYAYHTQCIIVCVPK